MQWIRLGFLIVSTMATAPPHAPQAAIWMRPQCMPMWGSSTWASCHIPLLNQQARHRHRVQKKETRKETFPHRIEKLGQAITAAHLLKARLPLFLCLQMCGMTLRLNLAATSREILAISLIELVKERQTLQGLVVQAVQT